MKYRALQLGFLLFVPLAVMTLKWIRTGRYEDAQRKDAIAQLDARFEYPKSQSGPERDEDLFLILLDSSAGREHVRRLAAGHDSIVYWESRNIVIFIPTGHGGNRRSDPRALVEVFVDITAGGFDPSRPGDAFPRVSHCQVSQYLSPTSLTLEDDTLSIRCLASSLEDDRDGMEHKGLLPGQPYLIEVALAEGQKPGINSGDLEAFELILGETD